ncbi:MAG: ORF6N domain-containing protein [Nitrospirota bacterium]
MKGSLIPQQIIENKILFIRGKKVMLDRDLAMLYGVETRVLNQAVRRNKNRFPEDFMFQLTKEEMMNWKSQIVISNKDKMGLRKRPSAFTENGVAMLSSVLSSERAITVNIQIMRTFTKLREILATHKDLAQKLEEMEKKYDAQFKVVFDTIRQLMIPPETKKRKIGFVVRERGVVYKTRRLKAVKK